MRLSKEEYKIAEGFLIRYNYNCKKIIDIREDLMSIGSPTLDGLPKPPFVISDRTLKTVVRLEENQQLKKAIREYNIVVETMQLLDDDCQDLFYNYYVLKKNKYEITNNILHISLETFKRRKRRIVYAIFKELKKIDPKLTQN